MSNRYRILLLIGLGLLVGSLWWFRSGRERHLLDGSATPVDGRSNFKASATNPSSAGFDRTNGDTFSSWRRLAEEQGFSEEMERRIQGVLAHDRQVSVPVSFFGRVIDQYDMPVEGARVSMTVRYSSEAINDALKAGYSKVEKITAADGSFELLGARSPSLTVDTILKDGYELSPKSRQQFQYYGHPSEVFRPELARPVVFRMWKKQGAEKLVYYDRSYRVLPDGRTYTVDLVEHSKIEGAGPGDLRVSLQRPLDIPFGSPERYDWSFSLQGVDGGVIPHDDDLPFQAPESGYQPRFEFTMSKDDPQWRSFVEREFYLRSRNGRHHARLKVGVHVGDPQRSIFSIEYFVNTNGSRNLEFDPALNLLPPRR